MSYIPFILVNGEAVSNFCEKAELFNSYFASQGTSIVNSSKLVSLEFKTNRRLENITFTDDDISLTIKNLKVDKEHG